MKKFQRLRETLGNIFIFGGSLSGTALVLYLYYFVYTLIKKQTFNWNIALILLIASAFLFILGFIVLPEDTSMEMCPDCNGNGMDNRMSETGKGSCHCNTCNGTGYIPRQQSDEKNFSENECSACGGSGMYRDGYGTNAGGGQCPYCGGKGYR
ncbi:MAG: hypothetical protein A2Y82_00735 [Candidatus Buchananbacteria bacterium RBG_13_36_9]|uniref:CR-type domain-containing protein n=1 Tax=Candidatus Buchananbacteria bacterium RBG_13_36_9 TaxID=1797530 RepID=A0A1G1XPC5_9BACT|nr:MAG: hypothetical protein A2Y82_00735 [Candidatus Buchananbacteria bacterium RBG_13_36_9]